VRRGAHEAGLCRLRLIRLAARGSVHIGHSKWLCPFLLSDRARFITGQNLDVNGGWLMG